MKISSKILAIMSLMVFAFVSQSASACVYPDGNCGTAEAAVEAAPAAEETAPEEEAAPAEAAVPAVEEAAED